MDAAAVFEHGGHVGAGLVNRVIDRGDDLAAQRHHVGAVDDLVRKLFFGGTAKGEARRAAVVDAELGLQAI